MADNKNNSTMFKANFDTLSVNNKVFDFIDKDKKVQIFDYSLFDKGIIVSDDHTCYRICNKEKHCIETLNELDAVVQMLVYYASENIFNNLQNLELKTNTEMTTEIQQGKKDGTIGEIYLGDYSNAILPSDRAIIEKQVIFDILFEKYKTDSKNMNLNEYCRHISETLPELTVAYFTPLNESIGDTKEQKLLNSTNALTSSIKRHLDKRLENLSSYLSVSIREINEYSYDYLYGKKIYEDYIKLGLNPSQILAKLTAPSTKGNEKKVS